MPDLHLYLRHDELRRFRNPHLMAIFRDPVAVAARNAISEQYDPIQAMIEANHAFSLDLAPHRVTEASQIRVRFNHRTTELANSGKSVAELKALRERR